jgi:hypothetical protein
MQKSLFIALLCLFALAACGQKLTAEANFCQTLIKDVFMPQQKLNIKNVKAEKTEEQNLVYVDYSIKDIMDKTTDDTAVCTFDVASEVPILTALRQFNNEVPQQYISFLNTRIAKILSGEKPAAGPQESKADITDIIPAKASEEPVAEPEAKK